MVHDVEPIQTQCIKVQKKQNEVDEQEQSRSSGVIKGHERT
jgi:hypothetical protein